MTVYSYGIVRERWRRNRIEIGISRNHRWARTVSGAVCRRFESCQARSTRSTDSRPVVTLLLSRGVPVKVVSGMLGHGDVAITLAIYQSVLPDMQESAAKAMEGALA
jgi:hypothetical protein